MTRLSACYFCGTALDESLDDYPVVPDARRGDDPDPTTVTLCQSCHEKLAAIVDEIDDVLAADAGTQGTTPSGSTTDAPDTEPPPADGEVNAVPDPRQPDDSAEEDASEPDPTMEPEGTEARSAPLDSPESGGDGPADATDPDPGDGANAADPDTADADDTEGIEDEDGERSVVEGKHDISALEYNKVMRLLQNREFPVDREEIEMVAANAYQVARADCEQVVDVAIDRGLIVEVDGQLRKPENV